MSTELKALLGTLARVFVAGCLTAFVAAGADAYTLDGSAVRTIVSAGVSAVAIAAYNWLNPRDQRYGIRH